MNELTSMLDKIQNKIEICGAQVESKLDKVCAKLISALQQAALTAAQFDSIPVVTEEELRKLKNYCAARAYEVLLAIINDPNTPISMRGKLITFLIQDEFRTSVRSDHDELIQKITMHAKESNATNLAAQQREQHAREQAALRGIEDWQLYLDDEDLANFAAKAPSDFALELVAQAYTHRFQTTLVEAGYTRLREPRKGKDLIYAHNYVKELLEHKREYRYVLTAGAFENDFLEINAEGQFRTSDALDEYGTQDEIYE